MSEREDVKNKGVLITLNGKDRILKLGMAAMERIESAFGSIDSMVKLIAEKPGSTMPKVIKCLLRTEGNEDLTMENLADFIDDEYSIEDIRLILDKLYAISFPEAKDGNPPKAE